MAGKFAYPSVITGIFPAFLVAGAQRPREAMKFITKEVAQKALDKMSNWDWAIMNAGFMNQTSSRGATRPDLTISASP